MAQPHSLWYMSRTSTPHHGVLECFLESTVDLIAHLFNRRLVPDDQGFTKVWLFPFSAKLSVESFEIVGSIYRLVYILMS